MSEPEEREVPVWLLDVDGVLNVANPGWSAAPYRAQVWSTTANREFRIRWAPALLKRVKALHRSGAVEIRWCTTWCGDTTELERALGLPAFEPCWTEYVNGHGSAVAKLAAARKVLADGRRLIWTDDDEVPTSGPLFDELMADGRTLLIRPDERHGLQPRHLDEIERFVDLTEAVR